VRAISITPIATFQEHANNVNSAYCQASQNSSLSELLSFVHFAFPEARILTLEGGHCKKPPKLAHFPPKEIGWHGESLPKVPTVTTLILKSAWNIMRTEEDFHHIMDALPSLKEWNTSYAKGKSKSYLSKSDQAVTQTRI
jgi:hypothetical protein